MAVIEDKTLAFVRLVKNIQCARFSNKNRIKLFVHTDNFRVKIKDVFPLFNWAGSDCGNEYCEIHISDNTHTNFNHDYIEEIFDISTVKYDDGKRTVSLKGDGATLFFSPEYGSGKQDCVYKFIKALFSVDVKMENYAMNPPALDELQYASPCEFGSVTLQKRKDLLKEIAESSHISDSREKTAIQLVSSVSPSDCESLLSYLAADGIVLRKLYEGIDDYRGEFVAALCKLFDCGKSALADVRTVSFARLPGVTEQRSSDVWESVFGWLYTIKLEVSCSFTAQNTIFVSSKQYRGMSITLESLWKDGQKQFEARPFDVVRLIDHDGAGISFVDIPLIVYKAASDKSIGDAVKKDFGALGKQTMDIALLRLGIANMAGASAMLKQETTLRNVVRLILGAADLVALELHIVCGDSDSEFCKAYREYELLILSGLLSANILNEMPALYNGLKKGLDDPTLTAAQKNKLREIPEEKATDF
jgi:hypothetical protein